jgi:hypothetical protein
VNASIAESDGMKALTLTQPWAQLVAIGAKKIETRSWNTYYRGPLAIHAAKGFPGWARQMCYGKFFLEALFDDYDGRWQSLPTGMIVATCELVHVLKIDTRIESSTTKFVTRSGLQWSLGARERAFGDYSLGRYIWLLDDIELLPEPIPAKGALGLWEFNGDLSINCSHGYDMNEVHHGRK